MAAPTIIRATSDIVLDTGMQYKIRNNTDHRLTTGNGRTDLLRYNRIAYRLEAGEEQIVPWAVIALYFGDPRSQHNKIVEAEDSQGLHKVPTRANELFRLSVFYGTYEQDVDILSSVVPDVTIRTLNDVEVIPPCFDPEGDFIYGFQRSMQKSGDVKTLIDDLQDQIDSLKLRQSNRDVHGDNDGDIPEDTPGL